MKRDYIIRPLRENPEELPVLARWFHEKWQVPLAAYEASMAQVGTTGIPQWYGVWQANQLIAGAGVIANDFHERLDLTPNICAVYVEPQNRGEGIAGELLAFICADLKRMGFQQLYLLTDHTDFYERYGWHFLEMVAEDGGTFARMYQKNLLE
jgi:N-acetylglutamate synthase and related acetyltransferases